MELLKTPVIVLSAIDNGRGNSKILKGSCRSTEHIDITYVLHACQDFLESYGGHRAAAGMSLQEGNLQEFKNKFSSVVKSLPVEKSLPGLIPEAEISIQEIFNPGYLNILLLCEPFGQGNDRPVFVTKRQPLWKCDRSAAKRNICRFPSGPMGGHARESVFILATRSRSPERAGSVKWCIRLPRTDSTAICNGRCWSSI